MQALGWIVDFTERDTLATSIVADGPDPDIGILHQPRLVSRVRRCVYLFLSFSGGER